MIWLDALSDALGFPVKGGSPVGGGCIAGAARVESSAGPLFVKRGRGEVARALEAEADGLDFLASALAPSDPSLAPGIPAVVAWIDETDGRDAFLVLEWIDAGRPDGVAWERLGVGLALLHGIPGEGFGHRRDNRIGTLPQPNGRLPSWPGFFAGRRLEPRRAAAVTAGLWRPGWTVRFEQLLNRIQEVLPAQPFASVLHGDLWSGNVVFERGGRPFLVDPAAYVGHAETDLAMTRLFGGFDARFHAAYDAARPGEPGAGERAAVYDLYHLLNHLLLFGESYAPSVDSALRRAMG